MLRKAARHSGHAGAPGLRPARKAGTVPDYKTSMQNIRRPITCWLLFVSGEIGRVLFCLLRHCLTGKLLRQRTVSRTHRLKTIYHCRLLHSSRGYHGIHFP